MCVGAVSQVILAATILALPLYPDFYAPPVLDYIDGAFVTRSVFCTKLMCLVIIALQRMYNYLLCALPCRQLVLCQIQLLARQ